MSRQRRHISSMQMAKLFTDKVCNIPPFVSFVTTKQALRFIQS